MSQFILHIKDGQISNKPVIRRAIDALADGSYLVEVKSLKRRSNQQNAYLHGVVIPMVYDGLRAMGFSDVRTKEDAKMVIKALFLKRHFVNPETGEGIEYIQDTSKLTKLEMNEFIEDVIRWAQEYLNCAIPYPNEQAIINF